jgi:hypothetical protein
LLVALEIGVGWDAEFTAPTTIQKVFDHLLVLEQSKYRVRRIALGIEFTKYLSLPYYHEELTNYTIQITCRYFHAG